MLWVSWVARGSEESMARVEREVMHGELDALATELAGERYRHVAGLEPEPALARIFAAHGDAAHRRTVSALEADGERELAARVAALRVERSQAEDEEAWRAAEATASTLGPDGPVSLADAQLAVADALLAASDDGYRDVLGWLARRDLGIALPPHGDLGRADLLFLLALDGWAGLFPRGMLAIVLRSEEHTSDLQSR